MDSKINFKFGDGIAYFGPFRVFFSPVNYFLYGIYHNSRDKSADEIIRNFKLFSQTDSKLIFNFLYKKQNGNKNLMLDDFLEIINSWGFGKVILIGNFSDRLFLNFNRCHMGNLHKKFFGVKSSFLIEQILIGFIENFIGFLYGKVVNTEFKLIGEKLSLECTFKNEDYFFETNRKYFKEKTEFTISNWLKTFIFSKNIGSNTNGTFAMGGIYAVCMPWFFGIDYLLSLIKDDIKFRDSLAKMEGRILVKLNSQNNLLSKNIVMGKILMNFGAAALGKFEIIDLNKGIFKMSSDFEDHFDSFYSKQDLFLLKRNVAMIICGAYEFNYDVNVDFKFDGTILRLTKLVNGRELNEIEKVISKNLTLKNFLFKL